MSDIGDFVLEQWKLAMRQVDGDPEGIVLVLATTLAFATAEGNQKIEDVIDRVRDDYETVFKAQADMLREAQQ